MKKYLVNLSGEGRHSLEQLISSGQAPARKLAPARILLKADEGDEGPGWSDTQISEALEVSCPTIQRVRQRFVEHGLEDAISRRRQPERPGKRRLDGEQEAHLIALTCGPTPQGHKRWSMYLLADKMVELGYAEHISRETVRRALKKTNSSPG